MKGSAGRFRTGIPTALRILLTIGAIALLGTVRTVTASSNTWISAASGKWETAANWSGNQAPSSSDSTDSIVNATTKTVTIDATTINTPSTLVISNLLVAGTASSTNTLLLNNAGTNTPLQILSTNLTLDTNGALVVNRSTILATNTLLALIVGNNGGRCSLTITNGGIVRTVYQSFVGVSSGSSSNRVLVSGTGSVWGNSEGTFGGPLYIGYGGPANQLIVTNGGEVTLYGYIGYASGSSNNTVLVSGVGSMWSNSVASFGSTIVVGYGGAANQLIITNGGSVYNAGESDVGLQASSSNNVVLVSGPGSAWKVAAGLL